MLNLLFPEYEIQVLSQKLQNFIKTLRVLPLLSKLFPIGFPPFRNDVEELLPVLLAVNERMPVIIRIRIGPGSYKETFSEGFVHEGIELENFGCKTQLQSDVDASSPPCRTPGGKPLRIPDETTIDAIPPPA